MIPANNRIFILSDHIRMGKTNVLSQWLKNIYSKGGFLTPDIDEKRKLLSLNTGIYHNFEVDESFEEKVSIGRFHFSKKVIDDSADEVLYILDKGVQYLVIDEIGRLEIESNLGFYPILDEVITNYKKPGLGYLILVIRKSLLQRGIEKFQLQNAIVLNIEAFKSATKNYGLILAGGDSSRMGIKKGLIKYHDKFQQDFLFEELSKHCEKVFLSLKSNTIDTNPSLLPAIEDSKSFLDKGPMSALLSAVLQNPLANWYVLACDYPLLKTRDIEFLYKYFLISESSVCYGKEKNYEPLLAIYHNNDFHTLWKMFVRGNESLRKFQEAIKPHVLLPINEDILLSVDTPEQMIEAQGKL